MQRVDASLGIDRATGGDEGLPRHLAPEDALAFLVWAHATEDVHLDGFEVEEFE